MAEQLRNLLAPHRAGTDAGRQGLLLFILIVVVILSGSSGGSRRD
jgi:hypothetical protein